VNGAVSALAAGGVSVRTRPTEPPLVAVAAPSRIGLMRFQARNLALEAHEGAGTLGSDLDAYAADAGTQPLAPLIAGWLRTAQTEAARQARTVAPDVDPSDPQTMVVPGLVKMLFLADLLGPPPAGTYRAGPQLAAVGALVAADDDFCGQVAAYLSGILGGALDPELALDPPWLAAAIAEFASIDADQAEMRKAAGALALLAFATSIARPWIATLSAAPNEVHYVVGEGSLTDPTKGFYLFVNPGTGSIAEEASECADLAGADLAGEAESAEVPIAWDTLALQAHAVDIEGDLELEQFPGSAFLSGVLEYETRSETEDAHRDGTLRTAVVPLTAIVERTEIRELETAVQQILTGGDLGATSPTVAAEYARLRPVLQGMLYPRATANVTVTWHEGPEETPQPTPNPSDDPDPGDERIPCLDDCAMSNGDPHIVTVDGSAYDFQAAGEFVLLRSADGVVEIQGRQVPLGDTPGVTINSALAARVDGHRIGVYVQDGARELRATIDGAPLDPSVRTAVGAGHARPVQGGLAWEIAFPDGSFAYAVGIGTYGINVLIEPAPALVPGARGVMGTVPDGSWAPALPDGSPLAATSGDLQADWHELYVRFADAWRVTQEASLFDYEAGQSAATFAMPAYPPFEDLVRPEDLTDEQRAAGEAECGRISDPIVREQCVFDVGITSDSGWATGYEATMTLVETGALPSTGALARVVNLYTENGQPVDLDVFAYAWSEADFREVGALVATVPYGQASDWFNPGSLDYPYDDELNTKIGIFRRGDQTDALAFHEETLGPGMQATIPIWTEAGFEGDEGAWRETIYAEHPEYPTPTAPPGSGLLVTRTAGLKVYEESPFLYASTGDGCLESPIARQDPNIPNVQPLSNDIVIPVGQHTLTLHDAPFGELPECDGKALGPGVPVTVAAGDRFLVFPHRLGDAVEITTLVIPFGAESLSVSR
jgi:hypothetical protein